MTKGAETTVLIREGANSALSRLCRYHHMTKVEMISLLVMGLATQNTEFVDNLISAGKIASVIVSLGGVTQYPDGIRVDDSLVKHVLKGIQ